MKFPAPPLPSRSRLLYRSSLVCLTTIWSTRVDTPLPCSLHPLWTRPYRINLQNTAEATLSHCRLLFCVKVDVTTATSPTTLSGPAKRFSRSISRTWTLWCAPRVCFWRRRKTRTLWRRSVWTCPAATRAGSAALRRNRPVTGKHTDERTGEGRDREPCRFRFPTVKTGNDFLARTRPAEN